MAGCFTAEGGERFMTLGRFNEESESDLEGCRDFVVKNNGDTIFTDFQTERLFVDDFGLYDLETFTFEDQAHCLLDSFYFEDPYDMGFVATYEGDTLNKGWSPPEPGLYEIDVMIGACDLEKSFEIEVSPCSSCLPEIAPVELCPGQEFFNPRDYVSTAFQVVDTLLQACPNSYAFPVFHPHCSEPIDILEIEVLDYSNCIDGLPLNVQCIGTELELPEGDHFLLDVGGFPIPEVWSEPTEIRYQFYDSFCDTEVESGTMRVIQCEDCDIYIPNVFSPNGDGINDYFEISTACDVQSAQVQIFDRQGRLIRESRQLDRIWDGRQEQPGVYIYRAQIEHTVAEGTQIRNLSGSLTLVR
jgi:gliding motility-associated-like protein